MNRRASFVVALATMVASFVACEGGNPVAPSVDPPPVVVPPPPGPVMAPPPAGLVEDGDIWALACAQDNRLYRPDGTVHLELSPELKFGEKWFTSWVEAVSVGFFPMDMVHTLKGANYLVSLTPGLTFQGQQVAALTSPNYDLATGRILGGKMEFGSLGSFNRASTVVRELFRTTGVVRNSPKEGLFYEKGSWPEPQPSPKEAMMLLGRLTPPLLAVCGS